jgi:hypothetical protein
MLTDAERLTALGPGWKFPIRGDLDYYLPILERQTRKLLTTLASFPQQDLAADRLALQAAGNPLGIIEHCCRQLRAMLANHLVCLDTLESGLARMEGRNEERHAD